MTPSSMEAGFEQKLVPGEKLLAVAEHLSLSFYFVTQVRPDTNAFTKYSGAMALTSQRMIASWQDSKNNLRWLHIPFVNSLSERPMRSDKSWPYQIILGLPGGTVLVAQTESPDAGHADQLAALVNQVIVHLGTRRDDSGSYAGMENQEEVDASVLMRDQGEARRKK